VPVSVSCSWDPGGVSDWALEILSTSLFSSPAGSSLGILELFLKASIAKSIKKFLGILITPKDRNVTLFVLMLKLIRETQTFWLQDALVWLRDLKVESLRDEHSTRRSRRQDCPGIPCNLVIEQCP